MADQPGWMRMSGAFAGFSLSPWRFAWEEATRTVILADVHLGAEAAMARQGIYLPDTSSRAIARSWEEVVKAGPRRVVIAGDLFDAALPEEAAVKLFAQLLAQVPAGCEVVLTRGNHDPDEAFLQERFGRLRIEAKVELGGGAGESGGVWVTHGHVGETMAAGTLIVGHQHPAVVLATRVQTAKMICFAHCLAGGGGRNVLVLPAFSPLPLGSNLMLARHWILALPAPAAEEIRVYGIVKEQVLDFGPLSGLMT